MNRPHKKENRRYKIIIRNVFIFFIPVSIAILIIMLFNLSQTVEHLSHALIDRTTQRTEDELKEFFNPVKQSLFIAHDWGINENYEGLEPEHLNQRFIPMLKFHQQISSMMIASEQGNEYMLLQEDSTWTNRKTTFRNGIRTLERFRWKVHKDGSIKLLKTWKETRNYNPLSRPWFIQAMNNPDPMDPQWTAPYVFFTTQEPGITVSTKWKDTDDNIHYVIGFDVLLMDISLFTTNLEVSKNGMAVIISENEQIIGLPGKAKYNSKDKIRQHVLKTPVELEEQEIISALQKWQEQKRPIHKPFQFSFNGEDWWAGVKPFLLNKKDKFYIAVLVPENDFMAEMNRTRFIITAGFILVIVLTFFVIRGYSQKRKAYQLLEKKNEQIEAQKDLIETKNKNITASITYAQRIQQTILPSDEYIRELFPDSFVLFRPKEIVSGDFYYFDQKGDHIIFTAVDCTGHGVPGAFVSMLGANLLNRAVNEKFLVDPGAILNFLSERIYHNLRKTGKLSTVKDGMDLTLCAFNKTTNLLSFAAAYNPLFLVRKDEILVYKAEKHPIGEPFSDRFKSYSNFEIKIQKGDQVYIFSDGYADQFGGPKRKKFLNKNFRQLLLEIKHLPMKEQRQRLIDAHDKWKGNLEQIDDIVIIGVRF